MVAGILALSMISNGIYTKETTDLKAHKTVNSEAENQQHIDDHLPKKPFVYSSLLTPR